MALDLANTLFESGRSHALSADLLYRASIDEARRRNVTDLEQFAFNGTHSLSVHYLLGLGLELMLKAAIVAWSEVADEKVLRAIGHDLIDALDSAEAAGFISKAPNLRDILEVLRKPYNEHWFRYERPDQFALPGDFDQVLASLEVLDGELRARLWTDQFTAA